MSFAGIGTSIFFQAQTGWGGGGGCPSHYHTITPSPQRPGVRYTSLTALLPAVLIPNPNHCRMLWPGWIPAPPSPPPPHTFVFLLGCGSSSLATGGEKNARGPCSVIGWSAGLFSAAQHTQGSQSTPPEPAKYRLLAWASVSASRPPPRRAAPLLRSSRSASLPSRQYIDRSRCGCQDPHRATTVAKHPGPYTPPDTPPDTPRGLTLVFAVHHSVIEYCCVPLSGLVRGGGGCCRDWCVGGCGPGRRPQARTRPSH